jgi:hypothetical protein
LGDNLRRNRAQLHLWAWDRPSNLFKLAQFSFRGKKMKRLVLVLLIPLVVSACGWKARQPTEARQTLKDQCVAGDFNACAEIGHMARAEMNAQSSYSE